MSLTKIEWTDRTWNPTRGCKKISPGCAHCYAETFAERFRGVKGHAYEQGFDLRLVPEKLEEPTTYSDGTKVFVNSMSDLFFEEIPDEYIEKVFNVMSRCPTITFQVLTKRHDRMLQFVSDWVKRYRHEGPRVGNPPSGPLPNVWLGISAEDEPRWRKRVPALLATPAAIRFVSVEPLLAEFRNVTGLPGINGYTTPLDWIIIGGESGPGARFMNGAWARDFVRACKETGIACFMKQMGSEWVRRGGPSKDRKGADPGHWPIGLNVRQFPKGA